jgi:hypothetical protein
MRFLLSSDLFFCLLVPPFGSQIVRQPLPRERQKVTAAIDKHKKEHGFWHPVLLLLLLVLCCDYSSLS